MPYWLSSGLGPGRVLERISNTLTEEQFDELPEILYEPPDDATTDHGDGMEDKDSELYGAVDTDEIDSDDDIDEVDIRVDDDVENAISSTADGAKHPGDDVSSNEEGAENVVAVPHDDDSVDVEQAPPPGAPLTVSAVSNATTTCTMCSICIDDFEAGEKLKLLPRCQHAFHRDCIHPWLTERQGCCPLCKTNVLEADDVVDEVNPYLEDGDIGSYVDDDESARGEERSLGNAADRDVADPDAGPREANETGDGNALEQRDISRRE